MFPMQHFNYVFCETITMLLLWNLRKLFRPYLKEINKYT